MSPHPPSLLAVYSHLSLLLSVHSFFIILPVTLIQTDCPLSLSTCPRRTLILFSLCISVFLKASITSSKPEICDDASRDRTSVWPSENTNRFPLRVCRIPPPHLIITLDRNCFYFVWWYCLRRMDDNLTPDPQVRLLSQRTFKTCDSFWQMSAGLLLPTSPFCLRDDTLGDSVAHKRTCSYAITCLSSW